VPLQHFNYSIVQINVFIFIITIITAAAAAAAATVAAAATIIITEQYLFGAMYFRPKLQ